MYVRKIIPQSTVDGPGNRTAIFLQGCNIRCAYCHNPETQALYQPSLYQSILADVRDMPVVDIVEEVKKCMPFIRGITISGGECMLQARELEILFENIKPLGLTCLIDSNGTIPFDRYPRLLDLCDGVMLDVKAWDAKVYRSLTGTATDREVKANLYYLLRAEKLTEVRIVCLPDGSPLTTDVENILNHLARLPQMKERQVPVRLLRFRPHGVVGVLKDMPLPSDEQMRKYTDLTNHLGLNVTIK